MKNKLVIEQVIHFLKFGEFKTMPNKKAQP
jgi:hypothetical protein